MARVDPGDDTIRRFVIWHKRYDPSRHQYQDVVVAAFDNEREYLADIHRRVEALNGRKQRGAATRHESIGGIVLDPGAQAAVRDRRIAERAIRAARERRE